MKPELFLGCADCGGSASFFGNGLIYTNQVEVRRQLALQDDYIWIGDWKDLPKTLQLCTACLADREKARQLEHIGSGPERIQRAPCSENAYAPLFLVGALRMQKIYEDDYPPEILEPTHPVLDSDFEAIGRIRREISADVVGAEPVRELFHASGTHAISVGKAHVVAAMSLRLWEQRKKLERSAAKWARKRWRLDRDWEELTRRPPA
ncbi:hypothetical protein [Poseidonocella sp. HB161398]|uniref:hypothetical protein n=1 Tax=Poseidonocella sp. HB161398 TaxID=2320855 RepID=UPI001109CDA0|nr:hypothetical protein [Poseidonocella sp. HB161398]